MGMMRWRRELEKIEHELHARIVEGKDPTGVYLYLRNVLRERLQDERPIGDPTFCFLMHGFQEELFGVQDPTARTAYSATITLMTAVYLRYTAPVQAIDEELTYAW